jgi:hypothetical protein
LANQGTGIAVIVVGAAAAAGLAYAYEKGYLTIGPAAKVADISIHASATQGAAPLTVTFTGMALDAKGSPVQGAQLYMFVNGSQTGSPATTDASGGYTFSATFNEAGDYEIDVADNTANS